MLGTCTLAKHSSQKGALVVEDESPGGVWVARCLVKLTSIGLFLLPKHSLTGTGLFLLPMPKSK